MKFPPGWANGPTYGPSVRPFLFDGCGSRDLSAEQEERDQGERARPKAAIFGGQSRGRAGHLRHRALHLAGEDLDAGARLALRANAAGGSVFEPDAGDTDPSLAELFAVARVVIAAALAVRSVVVEAAEPWVAAIRGAAVSIVTVPGESWLADPLLAGLVAVAGVVVRARGAIRDRAAEPQ